MDIIHSYILLDESKAIMSIIFTMFNKTEDNKHPRNVWNGNAICSENIKLKSTFKKQYKSNYSSSLVDELYEHSIQKLS